MATRDSGIDDGADVLRELLVQGRGLPPEGSVDDPATPLPAARGGVPSGESASPWWMEEADRLYLAERGRVPVELLSRRRPGLTLEDAYRVQWCGAALRVRERARVVGHKVGLTSEAMQQQVGIHEPDSGILLDSMSVAPSGVLRAAELLSPRIEAEIAFRFGSNLRGANVDEDDARAAVADVFLALEIIDTRYALQGITLADSVADNAACARFVLGDAVPMPTWDLRAEQLTVSSGGRPIAEGEGRAILGDPIRSVTWLTRRLAAFGAGLTTGDVVLAGAVHASIPLPGGGTVSVSSPHLPTVNLHIV
jgi:2-keto-4-pentenoate hydratase